jgi:hypothetical protein
MSKRLIVLAFAVMLSWADMTAKAQDATCLTARARALINAPVDVVFDTVADSGAYMDWNPFIIGVEPEGIDITVVGQRFDLVVVSPLDGSEVRAPEETTMAIRPIDPAEAGLLAYAFRGPGFKLLGEPEREQRFIPVGESLTLYLTRETFCGPAARFSYVFAQAGFLLQTPALKAEAERRAGSGVSVVH